MPRPPLNKRQSNSRLRRESNEQEYGYRLMQRTVPRNLPGIDRLPGDVSQRELTRNASLSSPMAAPSLVHSGSIQQLGGANEPFIEPNSRLGTHAFVSGTHSPSMHELIIASAS